MAGQGDEPRSLNMRAVDQRTCEAPTERPAAAAVAEWRRHSPIPATHLDRFSRQLSISAHAHKNRAVM